MRSSEPLRLSMLALLVLLLQLAWFMAHPASRTGADLYVVFLLLATAACGVPLGGVLALGGGVLMDLFGVSLPAFHVFYYLIPVAIGAQLRVHMLTQFRLLGAVTYALLAVGKIALQLAVLMVLGKLDSLVYMLKANYWPIAIVAALVYICWPWIVRLFPRPTEVRPSGH